MHQHGGSIDYSLTLGEAWGSELWVREGHSGYPVTGSMRRIHLECGGKRVLREKRGRRGAEVSGVWDIRRVAEIIFWNFQQIRAEKTIVAFSITILVLHNRNIVRIEGLNLIYWTATSKNVTDYTQFRKVKTAKPKTILTTIYFTMVCEDVNVMCIMIFISPRPIGRVHLSRESNNTRRGVPNESCYFRKGKRLIISQTPTVLRIANKWTWRQPCTLMSNVYRGYFF